MKCVVRKYKLKRVRKRANNKPDMLFRTRLSLYLRRTATIHLSFAVSLSFSLSLFLSLSLRANNKPDMLFGQIDHMVNTINQRAFAIPWRQSFWVRACRHVPAPVCNSNTTMWVRLAVKSREICVIHAGHEQLGDWRLENRDKRLETGDKRLETRDWRQETGDWRLETGDKRLETRDWRLETRD